MTPHSAKQANSCHRPRQPPGAMRGVPFINKEGTA